MQVKIGAGEFAGFKQRSFADSAAFVAEVAAFNAGCLAAGSVTWGRDEPVAPAGQRGLWLPAQDQNCMC